MQSGWNDPLWFQPLMVLIRNPAARHRSGHTNARLVNRASGYNVLRVL